MRGRAGVIARPPLVVYTNSYVSVDGTDDNISTPAQAGLSITGDLEIVARARLLDWTPAANSALVSHYIGALGYELRVKAGGLLTLIFQDAGGARVIDSTAGTGATDNTTIWVKATSDWDGTTFANNRVQRFYTAADAATEPVSWTQLGTDVPFTSSGAMSASTSNITRFGMRADNSTPMTGRLYKAAIRSVIGGPDVASFDPNLWRSGSTWTAATGEVYTLVADAAVTLVA
jgi:hypothetical protein